MRSNEDQYTLITNLEFVIIQDVRMFCHALLISEMEDSLVREKRKRELRGFFVDLSSEVFDMRIPSVDYKLVDAHSGDVFVGHSGKSCPLFSGAILKINGVVDIQLICGYRLGLDVHEFPLDTDICEVWDVLPRKVAAHWTAPSMPVVRYESASIVRATLRAIL